MTTYRKLLEGLQLRFFSPDEVLSYADVVRNGVRNSLPPRSQWPNIIPTLWVMDHLRFVLGQPVTLTSIYRNEDYNREVGGASRSQHKENRAIDFQVRNVSPRRAANSLIKLRDSGMFKGGVGVYRTFVHVDTRGRNATW